MAPLFLQNPMSTYTPGGMCVCTFIPLVVVFSLFIFPSLGNFPQLLLEFTHLPGADHQLGEPTPPHC